jgi:hypothetical protein
MLTRSQSGLVRSAVAGADEDEALAKLRALCAEYDVPLRMLSKKAASDLRDKIASKREVAELDTALIVSGRRSRKQVDYAALLGGSDGDDSDAGSDADQAGSASDGAAAAAAAAPAAKRSPPKRAKTAGSDVEDDGAGSDGDSAVSEPDSGSGTDASSSSGGRRKAASPRRRISDDSDSEGEASFSGGSDDE